MPLTHLMLDQLAVPVNRGDFPAFVAAVKHLPAADRDILAVLGAAAALSHGGDREHLSKAAALELTDWLAQFREHNIDET